MKKNFPSAMIAFIAVCVVLIAPLSGAEQAAVLPVGAKAVWDLDKAWHQKTATREQICVNGLWRWQPARAQDDKTPADNWGYFKVPGCWPGINDYMQKDSQTVFANPEWKQKTFRDIDAAWYEREIQIPRDWTGRRIEVSAEYVNSLAIVYIDGKRAGEIHFPAGRLDISSAVQAGKKHALTLHVIALPLKGALLSYIDSQAGREVKGAVERRGLCGDVYLESTPAGPRMDDLQVETSVRRGEIAFATSLSGLPGDAKFKLVAHINDKNSEVSTFSSQTFKTADVADGKFTFSAKWKPPQLWDLHTPENQFTVSLSLVDAADKIIDTQFDRPFGFRELWIDGKDFILNGSRIFLSAVPLDNGSVGVGSANYSAARETMLRLKRIGINFVYTHNYDCDPGSTVSLNEILRAADDVGMLVAVTQPHFSHYDWKAPNADADNGYARHAAFYAHISENHPSVVFYSTSHNATGYDGDMDPDQIDGIHASRGDWADKNVKLALRAEAIINKLDPTRIVYHHAGGNIGSMHSINFYPNFAPIQELSDWFGHWASAGVKPAFMCEYGAPFTWDWAMYRGWYKGKREFGSAAVPWELCIAEWNAQFLGDKAFNISDAEKGDVRWEAKKFAAGESWHRWDYPEQMGSRRFADRHTVLAMYTAENWRAYRTWGVSGISPWEYDHFWSLRDGVDRKRIDLPVDWLNLQKPGLSPDFIADRVDRVDMAYNYDDWIPTADGEALLANNQPVLAYIAGKASAFTEKGHDFYAGQTIEKQAIVINNSRQRLTLHCLWSLETPQPMKGEMSGSIETGTQVRIPIKFDLPASLPAGTYNLKLTTLYHVGAEVGRPDEQDDTFAIHVLPAQAAPNPISHIALFDPQGQTAAMLEKSGVTFERVNADADLAAFDTLIVGRLALAIDGPAPDISRVRDGLKVVVFEQSRDVLEKRLGFRAEEYGLRQVFKRIPDHPILAGIDTENLRDWNGEATTVSSKLLFDLVPMHGPTVKWCDIPVSRVWRCGTRGDVASVLIEKPATGDFRPILDGGFSLQFSPLMEYRQGGGMILFCQLDVTGRTETEPAAQFLVANLLRYVATWKPPIARSAIFVGDTAGKKYFDALGVHPAIYAGGDLDPRQLLILAPNAVGTFVPNPQAVRKFITAGGTVLAIGIDQKNADLFLPAKVTIKIAEHIGGYFDAPSFNSPFAGISPADAYNRGPKQIPLLTGGATIIDDGSVGFTLADSGKPSIVFCQIVPWEIYYAQQPNLKRTFRRSAFLLSRLLANLGVSGEEQLLKHFHDPVANQQAEKRWLDGLYLDIPEEWDDPYRFFRW